jgi:hypothetical protein
VSYTQEAKRLVVKRDATRLVGLGVLEGEAIGVRDHRPADHQAVVLDVGPAEAAEFAVTGPSYRGEPDCEAQRRVLVAGDVQDLAYLVCGGGTPLVAPEFRRGGERGGVAMDPTPSFGMDEGSTQDGVDLAYGRGRQRAAAAAACLA